MSVSVRNKTDTSNLNYNTAWETIAWGDESKQLLGRVPQV